MKSSGRVNVLTICYLALTTYCLAGGPPDTAWTKTYGGAYPDACWAFRQTSDNGYILGGWTGSYGVQALDFYVVKTDSTGDTLWTRTYGGQYRDEAYGICETSDSGYIITGWSSSFAPGRYLWIVKTDSVGDTLWTHLYQRQGFSWGWSIQECCSLGTYVVAGHDNYESYLMKINEYGDTIWTNKYGNGVLYDVQETSDSGYIAAGFLSFADSVFLVRTDKNGDSLWTRTFGHGTVNYGRAVDKTIESGYVIAGYTGTYSSADFYIIKTDSVGNEVWSRVYGGAGNDCAYSIKQVSDGGFIIAGLTESFGAGSYDIWIVKTDAFGDTVWTKTIGGMHNEIAYGIIECQDGGYAFAGYTVSFGAGASDYYLVKLASETGVVENTAKPIATPYHPATIIRGSLQLPSGSSCRVLDITGRMVNAANLSPGIYFIEFDDMVVDKVIVLK